MIRKQSEKANSGCLLAQQAKKSRNEQIKSQNDDDLLL